ncbi:VOC family protein [Tritonibacter mobilis]|uniref:Glyoxalase n=1 Tax=Tritonibacter mobilis F1926 TaxID=1265309 RepID=A0A1B1A8J7_9RHOB|nr:VOC family protein [Tritonibacter mobilis]ANP42847.1 glyoxalase [Tritonibacter mobilis F1926]KJZ23324.1 glyoxalase [Tritonibacter mobilis]
MKITTAGLILFTSHYQACVTFYRDCLRLRLLHSINRPGETLSTFDLGGAYLMIEPAEDLAAPLARLPLKLRFNVPDIKASCEDLRQRGVEVRLLHHGWGSTAEFCDPAGTRCALRSDAGFGV